MNVKSFEIYKYNLPLNNFLSNGAQNAIEREGFIIRLASETQEGFGEIAPLPGRSKESLDRVLAQLREMRNALVSITLPERIERLDGRLTKWLNKYELKPSVQFGLEMAILNLLANTRKVPLYKFISTATHDHIRINGLVSGTKESAIEQTLKLLEQKFTGIKLKVGPDIDKEIDKVHAVNEVINGHALLNLDANQSWDIKQAIKFGNEIGCALVEYIEEPFKDVTQIPEFFAQTTIPVALDETLQRLSFEDIKSIEGVDILVLKPTLLGGIEKTWDIMQKANRVAIEAVISSSFESSLGTLTLANLAGCSSRDRIAGLDTLKWFKENLLKDPLIINKGRIDIGARRVHSSDINFSLLEKIE